MKAYIRSNLTFTRKIQAYKLLILSKKNSVHNQIGHIACSTCNFDDHRP